jgi:hypothetical protein
MTTIVVLRAEVGMTQTIIERHFSSTYSLDISLVL